MQHKSLKNPNKQHKMSMIDDLQSEKNRVIEMRRNSQTPVQRVTFSQL